MEEYRNNRRIHTTQKTRFSAKSLKSEKAVTFTKENEPYDCEKMAKMAVTLNAEETK